MIFRKATTDDLESIISIIEDGRAALAALGIDQWQSGQPNAQMIKEDIEAGRSMVADQDGQVLGTLAFCVGEDPNYQAVTKGSWLSDQRPTPRPLGKYTALHRIAVAANAARQGIATFMIKSSFDLAREMSLDSARADTHEGNIPMQRAFEKCGMTYCCDVDIVLDEPTKKRLGFELLLNRE